MPRRRLNSELVEMARYLAILGPRVNELSRAQSRHKETVRYRYHRFFRRRGIGVQATISYGRLGFTRLVLVARLADGLDARSVFNTLSDLCYLRSYTRVMLSRDYVVHVAIPLGLVERCETIYRRLKDAGVFDELEVLEFEEMRNPPMKPDSFDFVRGVWRFDWNSAVADGSRLPPSPPREVARYDRVDLLILKELDADAGRSLVTMSENVKVNVHSLEFHMREHVQGRRLIRGYRLVWQGAPGPEPGQDGYVELTLLLKGAARGEVAELMLLLGKTPFLWSEAYGTAYCAEVFLPVGSYQQFLGYIDAFARRMGKRLRVLVMDQRDAVRFVISYTLFDGVAREWSLDEGAVLSALGATNPPVTVARRATLNS